MDENTNDQTPETSDTTPEEMASSSGQPDAGQPVAGPQPAMATPSPVTVTPPAPQPAQVVAAHPRAALFHNIMNVLGGGDKTQYSVDPQTGTMTATRAPQSTRQLANGILAGALTGMLAGAGERGPGSVGASFEKGGAAVMQQKQLQDMQAKQQAQQDYERQQKQIVQKAQLFEGNARALMNMQQAAKLGLERAQDLISGWDDFYNQADAAGAVVNPSISEAEVEEQLKSGKLKATDYQFVPRQAIDNGKGGVDYVGALVERHPTDITKDPENLKQAIRNGFVSGQPATGATMSNVGWGNIIHSNEQVNNAEAEIKRVYDKLGVPMPSMDDIVKEPGAAKALARFQRYMIASKGDPAAALAQMGQVTKLNSKGKSFTNPDASLAPLVLKAFGGQDNLDKYEEKVQGEKKTQQIKEDAEAKAQAESNTPKGKQDLINAQLTGEEKRQQIALNKQKLEQQGPTNTKHGVIQDGVDVDYLNSLPQDKKNAVIAVMSGRVPYTAQALRTAVGQNYLEVLTNAFPGDDTHPGFDATKATGYEKARIGFTSGKEANTLKAFSTALEHLKTANDNIDALGTVGGLNSLTQIGAFGPAERQRANALNTARQAVGQELARAYKTGVADKAEVESWENMLQTNVPSKLKDNIRTVAGLLKSQFDSLQSQWDNAVPFGGVSPIRNLASPQAKAAYQSITGQPLEAPSNAPPFSIPGAASASAVRPQAAPQQRTVPAGASPATLNGQTIGYVQNGVYHAF